MIEIQLNGKPYSLSEGVNIDSLLEELSIPKGKVAIELNRKVLHKENYTKTRPGFEYMSIKYSKS